MEIAVIVLAGLGLVLGLVLVLVWRAGQASVAEAASLRAELEQRTLGHTAELTRLRTELEQRTGAHTAAAADVAVLTDRLRDFESVQHDRNRLDAALKQALQDKSAADARLEQIKAAEAERAPLVEQVRAELKTTFVAVSSEVLAEQKKQIYETDAEHRKLIKEQVATDFGARQQAICALLSPVREQLGRVDAQLKKVETEREGAYRELKAVVTEMGQTHRELNERTRRLVDALKRPGSRGRWGEIQLENTVDLAGMREHCDFFQQQSYVEDGIRLRPDLVVRLPGDRFIAVDAKVPLSAYLDAMEADEHDQQLALLSDHAKALRSHVGELSAKKYWQQFNDNADVTVLFLPMESLLADALRADPGLIDYAAGRGIVLATPTTLILALKVANHAWTQDRLSREAAGLAKLGKDIFEALDVFAGHLVKVGKSLDQSVGHYNRAITSLESRLYPRGARMRELHGELAARELPELTAIETASRPVVKLVPTGEPPAVGSGAEPRPLLTSSPADP
jgi:DNA recombination protein RmuC